MIEDMRVLVLHCVFIRQLASPRHKPKETNTKGSWSPTGPFLQFRPRQRNELCCNLRRQIVFIPFHIRAMISIIMAFYRPHVGS